MKKTIDLRRRLTIDDLLTKDDVIKALSDFQADLRDVENAVIVWSTIGGEFKVRYTGDIIGTLGQLIYAISVLTKKE